MRDKSGQYETLISSHQTCHDDKMKSGVHSVENELFDVIGGFGPWQKTIFFVFFYGNTVGIFQNFAMTFLAPNVPFRCVEPVNVSSADEWPGQCTVGLFNDSGLQNWTEEVPCSRWEYDTSDYSDTLVSEWDLVCDREWLISFAKSVYMIGFMASVFIFGQVSDWFGRFPTIAICYSITCVSLLLSLFSTSITSFLIFRFLQAFGRTGFTTTGFVLIMEMVGPEYRTNVGIGIQIGWCLGFFVLGFIGYVFRHWFWFQVAIALPILPLAFAYRLIPESPRWLMMHKKTKRLKELIRTATTKNRRPIKEDMNDILGRLITVKDENKGTLVDLFRTPKLRCKMFNMMYLWLVNAFVYYALSFNTNDFSGDPYVNFLLCGLLEFPSYGLLFVAIHRFGRRFTLVSLMMAGGASCVALLLVPGGMEWLSTCLALCGKFCVTASFGLLYLYTGELFPTVVRSAALGSCSTVARIGSIVAPFSRELGKATHPLVPNVVYSILAVSSGLFALWLPETAGRKMPDTLEEGENYDP